MEARGRGGSPPEGVDMELSIDWVAVSLATVSTMVVGTLWYRPAVFGRRWQALTGKDPNAPAHRAAAGIWLGFTAARMLVHDQFAGRDLRIWLLDAGYELTTVLVMAVIIGLLG